MIKLRYWPLALATGLLLLAACTQLEPTPPDTPIVSPPVPTIASVTPTSGSLPALAPSLTLKTTRSPAQTPAPITTSAPTALPTPTPRPTPIPTLTPLLTPIPTPTSVPTPIPTVAPTLPLLGRYRLPIRGLYVQFERGGSKSTYCSGQLIKEFHAFNSVVGTTVAKEGGNNSLTPHPAAQQLNH